MINGVGENCAVCGVKITASDWWYYHARLAVYLCGCDFTNVNGEDISMHTMYWGLPKEEDK